MVEENFIKSDERELALLTQTVVSQCLSSGLPQPWLDGIRVLSDKVVEVRNPYPIRNRRQYPQGDMRKHIIK